MKVIQALITIKGGERCVEKTTLKHFEKLNCVVRSGDSVPRLDYSHLKYESPQISMNSLQFNNSNTNHNQNHNHSHDISSMCSKTKITTVQVVGMLLRVIVIIQQLIHQIIYTNK